MQIVPVIDLKQGTVVHARSGRRDRYRPVRSRLCRGSDPVMVVDGLLSLYPFRVLYVADLDAIAGEPGHDHVLERIAATFSGLGLWVDCGISSTSAGLSWLSRGLGELVLGSENLTDCGVPGEIAAAGFANALILSLDFAAERFLGPAELARRADLWPERVIAMTLSRVGGDAGPDLARLDEIAGLHRGRRLFAAGGVRNINDIHDLASRGLAGVLVASALHDGRLRPRDIAAFAGAGAR